MFFRLSIGDLTETEMGDVRDLELAIERELACRNKNKAVETTPLSRTASFGDWMNASSSISDATLHNLLALYQQEPTSSIDVQSLSSSQAPENQMGQSSTKTWPSSDKQTDPRSLISSAAEDWIGPSRHTEREFHQAHHHSSIKVPTLVEMPKLFPGPSTTPTKARSSLKRKATGGPLQLLPHRSPPPSPNPSKMTKKPEESSNLVCEICQVSCSSALTLRQHLIGRPHKAKLEWMKMKRNCTAGGKMGKPRCDVCQIWCSDRSGLEMHYKGAKHKAKLKELELCKRNGTAGNTKKPITCELCLVHCMNEDLFQMHLKGRPHAARQELERRGLL